MKHFITISMVMLLAVQVLAQDESKTPVYYYELGENASHARRYEEALKNLNECIRLDPQYAEAYSTRGAVKEQLNDMVGALTDYSICLEFKPDNPEALLSCAIIRYKLGRYDQAKADFTKLLILPKSETTAILYRQAPFGAGTNQITTTQSLGLDYLLNYIGQSEIKLGNYKSAITYFDSAIQMQPNEPDYYLNRGLAKEGLQDSTAREDYQKALKLNPDNSLAMHNLAALNRKSGKISDADDQLTKAIETDTTMLYAYIERAFHRLQSGYYKGALEDYSTALKIDDSDPEIWLNRGIVKEKIKDTKGAYADYSKAINLDQNFVKAWLNRGNLLTKQGKYEEAIEDYTYALTLDENYANAFYNRAIARQRLKQTKDACDDLKKAEALGMLVDAKMKAKICVN